MVRAEPARRSLATGGEKREAVAVAPQGNRVKKCVTNGWGAESVLVL
jgi:hypothetical protein